MTTQRCMQSITEKFPLGQCLLKAGMHEITMEEIYNKLNCDEISRLENNLIRSNLEEKAKEMSTKYIHYYVRENRFRYYLESEFMRFWKTNHNIGGSKVECKVDFIDLDSYAKQEIPDHCIEKVNQAREIGLSKFYVAYPFLRPMGDSIIIGKIKNNEIMFYITEW